MDKVTSIFQKNHIKLNIDIRHKEETLRYLAELALDVGVSHDLVQTYESMLKREGEFTTGFGEGFAIPHAKCASIVKPGVFLVKLKSPIDWNAIDGEPVSLIIGLLTPAENNGSIHLTLLASLSRKLMEEDFKKRFFLSHDQDELFNLITEALTAFENE
ncbi:PTS sugar transporter subunit IIA [Geosporobacter ferrireducens]|uniref:PTS EIIA type-2 domain-containing protein n=1 Tax=Geosporobacter ferrireducens TaxID=1424294 RepID=A0A1D8GHJ6_9FIRM|nr:PTS sugar transporter subunit IIA [Geosporobacter ferrireducens]AOT70387.1 hypothetical protein Gferi_12775 [Geosporobacter ferrireducens]MTI57229.1 PTS sugar transporter subunit IIA [Geosporobacter ferrireducens]